MSQAISKDMTFGDLIRKYPQAAPVLGKYGLHCIGCHIGIFETIEQGVKAHGLDDQTVDQIVKELNEHAKN